MNTRRRTQLGDDRTPDVAAASDLDRRRLAEALDAVGDAIVVVDAAGEVVLRNRSADRFHDARHADALAGGALRELLDRARNGEECSPRAAAVRSAGRGVLHDRPPAASPTAAGSARSGSSATSPRPAASRRCGATSSPT